MNRVIPETCPLQIYLSYKSLQVPELDIFVVVILCIWVLNGFSDFYRNPEWFVSFSLTFADNYGAVFVCIAANFFAACCKVIE